MSADETEWEYSIAYPDGHPSDGRWSTDGAEIFDSLEDAEWDLRAGGYLDTDRVVRRRKAGPWGPIPESDVSEEER